MRISVVPLLLLSACSNTKNTEAPPDLAMPMSLGAAPPLNVPCSDAPADVYTLPSSLPPMSDAHRGDVFRCAPSESLSASWANMQATAMGYPGPALASGFWTYRIAFRSERASDAATGPGTEGDMAAVLAIPEKPLPGAPLVVYAHPTVGIAPNCATSYTDLSDPNQLNDYSAAVIPLAAYGYTVIVPDYSGYSYGQPPGYFNAEDEAHAILDATRAATNALPADRTFDKVVLVGHSQGGHAVLSADHYASSYGLTGKLIGVATYAPFWTSMAAFAGITSPLGKFNTTDNGYAIEFALFYLYSQGELRQGPGMGLSLFQPAKRALVQQTLIGGVCYDLADLKQLGTTPYDFVNQSWVDDVGTNCAIAGDCSAADSMQWLGYWKKDRPSVDPNGPPILVWFSAMDQNVTLGFAQCARDKLAMDLSAPGATSTISYCLDPSSAHSAVAKMNADYVNQWIAARAGIGPEPATCPSFPSGQSCQMPPQNY